MHCHYYLICAVTTQVEVWEKMSSSVTYFRTPHVTYRTQAATNENIGNLHSSHRPIQQISIRGNTESPVNATQRKQ